MKAFKIGARERKEKGTRACRRLRAGGEVPANLYGFSDGAAVSEMLAVSAYDVTQAIDKHSSVLEVSWSGREELVQLSEVQRDQFGDDILHIDLHMIDANKPMHAEVSIVVKGDAKGVREGGKLNVELKELEIEALPRKMPREIVVRVDDLGVGQALHVNELDLPAGVTALTPGDFVVLQVVEPAAEGEGEEEGGTMEPELIAKGKKEAEGEE